MKKQTKMNKIARNEERTAWMFLLPALLLLIAFAFAPIINALWISLHSWQLLTDMEWVGLENFAYVIRDAEWRAALKRTFIYVACYVPSLYVMSLLLAMIVKHIPKGKAVFRTMFFAPIISSSVATATVWKLLYGDKLGVLNKILEAVFDVHVGWLTTTKMAMTAVLIMAVWSGMGYYMIIFLAGLNDIPANLYEAAKIDGANGWQCFWSITLPNLKNTSFYVLIMSMITAFQSYDAIKVLTDGGPNSSTKLAVQYIYENGFRYYNMGYAVTCALYMFVIILFLTILQFKNRNEVKS